MPRGQSKGRGRVVRSTRQNTTNDWKKGDVVWFVADGGRHVKGIVVRTLLYKYNINGNDGKKYHNVPHHSVSKSKPPAKRVSMSDSEESSEEEVQTKKRGRQTKGQLAKQKKRRTGPAAARIKEAPAIRRKGKVRATKPVIDIDELSSASEESDSETSDSSADELPAPVTPKARKTRPVPILSVKQKKSLQGLCDKYVKAGRRIPWVEIQTKNKKLFPKLSPQELKSYYETKKLQGSKSSAAPKTPPSPAKKQPAKSKASTSSVPVNSIEPAMHHRKVKKANREFFTKQEVKVLMVCIAKRSPGGVIPKRITWKEIKEERPSVFVRRTCIDLKDKFRNLKKIQLAQDFVDRILRDDDISDLLERATFRRSSDRKAMHYRSDKVKKRKPWTAVETHSLVEGMEKFGQAWTKIKEAYSDELSRRTTLDLKDKFRNLQKAK